jgi:transcriptional regulator with XRE-family HTH domain
MKAGQLVAWNLRRIRVQHGIPQEALAVDAGVDRTYVSRVERGLENPSVGVVERFALALSVDITELFRRPAEGEEQLAVLKKGRKPKAR